MKKILILGGTGMLGHTLLAHLSKAEKYEVYATARSLNGLSEHFPAELKEKIRTGVDADNFDTVVRAIASLQPDIVINCIGIIKQLWMANDPLSTITINSQLPHRISLLCRAANIRLIHISTDCIFSGEKGGYIETDFSDADDLYGRTKFLGEVSYPHCLTLRTSLIGHEQKGFHGIVEWFMRQQSVRGFSKAIFTGFPTVELAHIIQDYLLENKELHGIYHVSSQPISKFDLLQLISNRYGMKIEIEPVTDVSIDRSLDSTRLRKVVGYQPPPWSELINKMYENYAESPYYKK